MSPVCAAVKWACGVPHLKGDCPLQLWRARTDTFGIEDPGRGWGASPRSPKKTKTPNYKPSPETVFWGARASLQGTARPVLPSHPAVTLRPGRSIFNLASPIRKSRQFRAQLLAQGSARAGGRAGASCTPRGPAAICSRPAGSAGAAGGVRALERRAGLLPQPCPSDLLPPLSVPRTVPGRELPPTGWTGLGGGSLGWGKV